MEHLMEPARSTPVAGRYDVVVAGGGVAGVAAALAAARSGARTALLEREYLLGGLGTLGLIAIYLPICDGRGHLVSTGIAEELLRLSIRHGCEGRRPAAWLDGGSDAERQKQRFEVQYNPWLFAIDCEEALRQAGVEIVYGCTVCGLAQEGGNVTALLAETRDGRRGYAARAFVDAGGSADLFAAAGCPTALHEGGNSLAAWYYLADKTGVRLRQLGFLDLPENDSELDENMQKGSLQGAGSYHGMTAEDVSRMTMDAHAAFKADFLTGGPLAPDHRPAAVAALPQLRMTRRLAGAATPDETPFAPCPDSIGLAADWRRRGPVFELSYGSLYSPGCQNLFAAGRCISVSDALWDVTRVIPCCALTGQAAGTAAALTASTGRRAGAKELQAALAAAGVLLHADFAR